MKETHETQPARWETSGEPDFPAFNDATDHYQRIIGVPNKRADLNAMPKFVRWFAYFFYAVLILGAIAFAVSVVVNG